MEIDVCKSFLVAVLATCDVVFFLLFILCSTAYGDVVHVVAVVFEFTGSLGRIDPNRNP